MTGRQESNLKTETHILELISKQPKILSSYYHSMEEKTPKTKLVYINHIIEYFRYLNRNGIDVIDIASLATIKKEDIYGYLSSTKYRFLKNGDMRENGESIRRSKIFAIKNFFDYLCDNGYLSTNPCDNIKLPALSKEISVVSLTEDEINKVKEKIINSNDPHWKRDLAIFTIGIRTGLRIASIIEMNVDDINWEEKFITVTEKGNKKREVYFGKDTKKVIFDWIIERGAPETKALFINDKGERITYTSPYKMIKKYTKDINKNITCHKMRSTCGTNLYEKTGDIYLVADVLGHKNISNTRRYANISQKKRKEAAGVLDEL